MRKVLIAAAAAVLAAPLAAGTQGVRAEGWEAPAVDTDGITGPRVARLLNVRIDDPELGGNW